ncbi:MAG: hypothetical protein B7Y39_10675 [Bdellovibrio sp. 28-41-41]|nr:MAG: hypothetical protein B7Y39_10675 [Bdellovibrio sp. 28-41-41]
MQNSNGFDKAAIIIDTLFKFISIPSKEIFYGIKSRTIPWTFCSAWAGIFCLILFFKIDHYFFQYLPFRKLYPYHPILYKIYCFSLVTCSFWLWSLNQARLKKQKLSTLTAAFKSAGLVSKIGRLPNLVSDYPIDGTTRKMRLTNAGFPVTSFKDQSRFVESELGIFIDEVREDRETRTVDYIYSHFPIPSEIIYSPDLASKTYEFPVGQTRANTITANLKSCPHLLVAGQTGGGKSTFLRQVIVHLAIQNKNTHFLLIDLKGGLEFSLFENRKQFEVVPSVKVAIAHLNKIETKINQRLEFLKAQDCKDVDAYYSKANKPKDAIDLNRFVVVIDEAAEMFLAGHHAKANEVQQARGVLSKIARQGRALGIHLIVATQRPDVKSLDPQVKANLVGVICFQMMNDASSIAVLGNGRATDLPKVPGRAIWKNGADMIEVQTPYLAPELLDSLIGKPDNTSKSKEAADVDSKHSNEEVTADIEPLHDSSNPKG